MQETQVQILDQEDPLEMEIATHSSILAWRVTWTEEPGGLQSMGSQRDLRCRQILYHLSHHDFILMMLAVFCYIVNTSFVLYLVSAVGSTGIDFSSNRACNSEKHSSVRNNCFLKV